MSEQDAEPLFRILDGCSSQTEFDIEQKTLARQELIDNLMDRHGTGRILFRNTRAAIQGFPERHVHMLEMPMPEQYTRAMRVSKMMDGDLPEQTQALKNLYPEEDLTRSRRR